MNRKTLTLTREQARWFVDAALSSISTDDITPIICSAQISITDNVARIICTDRYRVTLATLPVKSTADHEFILPRAALVWLGKNLAIFGRYKIEDQKVTIVTTEAGALTVTIWEAATAELPRSVSYSGQVARGNFPPVERLFETAHAAAEASPARVSLDFIAKARIFSTHRTPPLIKFTVSENPNKPGPMLLSFEKLEVGMTVEVLIQPNLMLR